MSTIVSTGIRGSAALRWTRRGAWGVLALFLAAFAVFESVKYGFATSAAALVFFVLPDLTMFVGAGDALRDGTHERGRLQVRAVPFYNALHRAWVPLIVLVGYSVGPIEWPPLFTAGLGWLTHIAMDRAAGYGLRTPEGFRRHV
ncbi:DUF4260 family protein [Embleya hyalina]|uniref:Membrane protein n=1 Tax=Embleya hyalina TaxID=516124 RepID=A0A401YRV5_9ACTN|nr:DUF4260 family protein [Embleya hyalina]GCD97333.1 membrane protein [Embleya hyalina]